MPIESLEFAKTAARLKMNPEGGIVHTAGLLMDRLSAHSVPAVIETTSPDFPYWALDVPDRVIVTSEKGSVTMVISSEKKIYLFKEDAATRDAVAGFDAYLEGSGFGVAGYVFGLEIDLNDQDLTATTVGLFRTSGSRNSNFGIEPMRIPEELAIPHVEIVTSILNEGSIMAGGRTLPDEAPAGGAAVFRGE